MNKGKSLQLKRLQIKTYTIEHRKTKFRCSFSARLLLTQPPCLSGLTGEGKN